jgi:prevent-host-death family protein
MTMVSDYSQSMNRHVPAKHVSKTEFKARALELLRQVEKSGESLIVTDRGEPVVELRPVRKLIRDPVEFLRGTVLHYEDPTEPIGVEDWEALSETE